MDYTGHGCRASFHIQRAHSSTGRNRHHHKDAARTATQELLAVRVTNFDGLTAPVMVETPPMAESRSYQNTSIPYAVVDIRVERIQALTGCLCKNAQVFPDTETRQELSLIPTPDLPSSFDRTETFVVPPQSLS